MIDDKAGSDSLTPGGRDDTSNERRKSVMATTRQRLMGAAAASALALTLAGCGSSGDGPADGGADPVGTWGAGGEGQPQIELTEDGAFAGTDGCNQIGGTWEADGSALTFGPVRSTMMFCDGVDDWLSGMSSATIDATTMTVLDEGGTEIGTLTRDS